MCSGKITFARIEALRRLVGEDAVGQLRRGEGLMAQLACSETGQLKLDWVEGVRRLLDEPGKLEGVEDWAREIWHRGIRHIIWSGMGGSITTVKVLVDMGFCAGSPKGLSEEDETNGASDSQHIAIYPLESTDPAAIKNAVEVIARAKGMTPRTGEYPDALWLGRFLEDVMMVAVSMGMTSEEPITHLAWFLDLLQQAELSPDEHTCVMTLPDSFLHHFAYERLVPEYPLQLDRENGIVGRMSAPTTCVFLLPAALHLVSRRGHLRGILQEAWRCYDLDQAEKQPAGHVFVQLAVALYEASVDGACRALLHLPGIWQALAPWIEQLMEQSTGKGGKGIVVFREQFLNEAAPGYCANDLLHIHVISRPAPSLLSHHYALYQPYLLETEAGVWDLPETDPEALLAAIAASFLGWQLTMALYAYLHSIPLSTEPAVERYKFLSRKLRNEGDPLQVIAAWPATFTQGRLTLLAPLPRTDNGSPAGIFARALLRFAHSEDDSLSLAPGYLDITINGELPRAAKVVVAERLNEIGNIMLGLPVKLRSAPAEYHVSEQSEMDGPAYLVSLRILARDHTTGLLGVYQADFLHAQAVATWQAMIEQGRSCFLLLIDEGSSPHEMTDALQQFLLQVVQALVDSGRISRR